MVEREILIGSIGKYAEQTEYPFLRYNLFYYGHILSFYSTTINDSRFLEAVAALDGKVERGKMVVENPNPANESVTISLGEVGKELYTVSIYHRRASSSKKSWVPPSLAQASPSRGRYPSGTSFKGQCFF